MASRQPLGQIHVVVTAHEPKFLPLTLLGVAHQSHQPQSVVVSCDNDHPDFLPVAQAIADQWQFSFELLIRPFAGEPRPAQVRNNGIRRLIERGAAENDLIVFFDGDSCPRLNTLQQYAHFGQRADLVIGQRYRLTEEETQQFDQDAFLASRPPVPLQNWQLARIAKRHRRGAHQRWLQMLNLNKPHKPKLLGANHGIRLNTLKSINGFDERFMGWGSEDDDLSRRAYRAGAKPAIAIRQILVYHQFHPEREQYDQFPEHTHQAAQRLRQPFIPHCPHGIENPMGQESPQIHLIQPQIKSD